MVIKREDWKGKDEVFTSIEEKVDRIIAYRQNEFAQVREKVRKQLAAAQPVVEAEGQPAEKAIENSAEGEASKGSKEAEELAVQEEASEDILNNAAGQTKKRLEEEKEIGTVESKKLMSESGPASIS